MSNIQRFQFWKQKECCLGDEGEMIPPDTSMCTKVHLFEKFDILHLFSKLIPALAPFAPPPSLGYLLLFENQHGIMVKSGRELSLIPHSSSS